jgi:hypothetical protein
MQINPMVKTAGSINRPLADLMSLDIKDLVSMSLWCSDIAWLEDDK